MQLKMTLLYFYNAKFSFHNLCILKSQDLQDKSPHELEAWWLGLSLKTYIFWNPFILTSIFRNLVDRKEDQWTVQRNNGQWEGTVDSEEEPWNVRRNSEEEQKFRVKSKVLPLFLSSFMKFDT